MCRKVNFTNLKKLSFKNKFKISSQIPENIWKHFHTWLLNSSFEHFMFKFVGGKHVIIDDIQNDLLSTVNTSTIFLVGQKHKLKHVVYLTRLLLTLMMCTYIETCTISFRMMDWQLVSTPFITDSALFCEYCSSHSVDANEEVESVRGGYDRRGQCAGAVRHEAVTGRALRTDNAVITRLSLLSVTLTRHHSAAAASKGWTQIIGKRTNSVVYLSANRTTSFLSLLCGWIHFNFNHLIDRE